MTVTREDTPTIVRRAVAKVLATPHGRVRSIDDVEMDSDLLELGADSLDVVGVSMELEEHYGREFDERAMRDCILVSDIVTLVERTHV